MCGQNNEKYGQCTSIYLYISIEKGLLSIFPHIQDDMFRHRNSVNGCFLCRKWDAHGFFMMSSNGNIFRVTGPLCGEFTGPGEFPTQRPVTQSFDVFFDLRLNKRLSKQPWGWWFETLSWSLWRHCNVVNQLHMDSLQIWFNLNIYFGYQFVEAKWHIYVSVNVAITASDIGLSPVRCQALMWANPSILSIGLLETNFNEILIKIQIFHSRNHHARLSQTMQASGMDRYWHL